MVPSPSPAAALGPGASCCPHGLDQRGGHPLLAQGEPGPATAVGKAPRQLVRGRTAILPLLTPATAQHTGRGAMARGEATTEWRGGADAWHPWAPLLPLPGASFFFLSFFSVCFNFIVFPMPWEGAAAKNNVAKPRGLAHAA